MLVYECISGGGLSARDAGDASLALPCTGLLAQGTAMRDALVADLLDLEQLSVSCAAAWYAPLPATLAGAQSLRADAYESATDFLALRVHGYDRVWVIAPESDGLLASLVATVGHTRWVGCSPPAIRLAASKSATRSRLAAYGISVPASWRPGETEPPDGSLWIVKPDDGAGCEATRLHADFAQAREDLLGRIAQGLATTLESWVDGIPLSLSLLCADGRAELLSINRQRVTGRPGALLVYHGVDVGTVELGSVEGRRLARLAQEIAAAVPGLAGYVGVDLIWCQSGGPVVVEINPRLTCAYVGLSAALGRNLAGEILNARHPEATPHAVH
ncbi:MAG: ATP-grasp domain-containing protein [Azoarcus sp.]|nr:ATP-grasp domain-containing protein [Azoarcus sp.]